MRLGLFGGSFDPVHFGHLLLAECCREQCRLDRVDFLPAGRPPHKLGRELSPAAARIEMLQLATAGHEAFRVSRFEADRDTVSYTVETLRHYRSQEPDAELFFLLGADMLHDLPHWREAAEVCTLATIAAVRRAGEPEPDFQTLAEIASPQRIALFRSHQVEMPLVGLRSTDLRRRAAAGQSLRYRTPRAVEKYIETHRLYADSRPE